VRESADLGAFRPDPRTDRRANPTPDLSLDRWPVAATRLVRCVLHHYYRASSSESGQ
jgi:hypothetical protein